MRIREISDRLTDILPMTSDYFSSNVSLLRATATQGRVTIFTEDDFDFFVGQSIGIRGLDIETPLASVSSNGMILTFSTTIDHDLTFGWPEHENIDLIGFDDDAWNGSFMLNSVPNRRTFSVKSDLPAPTLNGSEVLLEAGRIDGISRIYTVLGTEGSNSAVVMSPIVPDGTYSQLGATVRGSPRITYTSDIETASNIYSQSQSDEFYMFVIAGDGVVSRDPRGQTDGVSTRPTGSDLHLTLIDNFSIFVFASATENLGGGDIVDICRHDIFGSVLKALYGRLVSDSGSSAAVRYKVMPTGYSLHDFNGSYVIYRYDFEVPIEYTNMDAVIPVDTRAFRDVSAAFLETSSDINLDEDPLNA